MALEPVLEPQPVYSPVSKRSGMSGPRRLGRRGFLGLLAAAGPAAAARPTATRADLYPRLGAGTVTAIDAASGAVEWTIGSSYPTPPVVAGPTAVTAADGVKLLRRDPVQPFDRGPTVATAVGGGDGLLATAGDGARTGEDQRTVNPHMYEEDGFLDPTPLLATDGGSIYATTIDDDGGTVVAMDAATGRAEWTASAPSSSAIEMSVIDDVLIVALVSYGDGTIALGYDRETGERLWRTNWSREVLSATVHRETLYATAGEVLHAVDAVTGTRQTIRADEILDVPAGRRATVRSLQHVGGAGSSGDGGAPLLAVYASSINALAAVDTDPWRVAWQIDTDVWFEITSGGPNMVPGVSGDGAVFVAGRALRAIDRENGVVRRRLAIGGGPFTSAPAIGSDGLYVGAGDRVLSVDRSGSVQWTADVTGPVTEYPDVDDNGWVTHRPVVVGGTVYATATLWESVSSDRGELPAPDLYYQEDPDWPESRLSYYGSDDGGDADASADQSDGDDALPGLGVGTAVTALVGGGLLAARRAQQDDSAAE